MGELFLRMIRENFSIADRSFAEELSSEDWKVLFDLARDLKVTPLFANAVREHIPDSLRYLYTGSIQEQLRACASMRIALRKIESTSRQENLRFVLLKGMAISMLLYGDDGIRQAGDIDILVLTEDLARCDYAMRVVGFFQPDTSSSAKGKSRQVARFLQCRAGSSIPYFRKRQSSSDQLLPYYDRESLCRIEVHDGYKFLSDSLVSEMFWSTISVRVGGVRFRTFDFDHLFILLLVTAYANSHGYYPAVDGEFNLRDYVDIHCLLKNHGDSLHPEKIGAVLEKHNLRKVSEDALGLYRRVYGESCCPLPWHWFDFDSAPANENLDLMLDRRTFKKVAEDELKARCAASTEGSDVDRPSLVGSGKVFGYPNRFNLDIACSVTLLAESFQVCWRVPLSVADDFDLFALRLAFIPSFAVPYLEFSVACYRFEGREAACYFGRRRLVPGFSPSMAEGDLEISASPNGDGCLLTVTVPLSLMSISSDDCAKGIGLIPSVYMLDSSVSYCDINCSDDYSKIEYIYT